MDSHLAHILDEEMQKGIQQLILKKVGNYSLLQNIMNGLWIGGYFENKSMNFEWTNHSNPFQIFSKWTSNQIGYGCPLSGCTMNHSVIMNPNHAFQWAAKDHMLQFPFICMYRCVEGYLWSKKMQKCIRISKSKR